MPAPNNVAAFWKQVRRTETCWIWAGAYPDSGDRRRYGRFGIGGKKHAAHRYSWTLAHGPIPHGLHVLHRCDNPGCVRPEHLFLGTHTDNMRDMFSKKRRRILRGEDQGAAKLECAAVIRIREQYQFGARQVDLAAQHGIDQTTVSKIVRRQAWQHIGDPS